MQSSSPHLAREATPTPPLHPANTKRSLSPSSASLPAKRISLHSPAPSTTPADLRHHSVSSERDRRATAHLVAHHYNARLGSTVQSRQFSPIFRLRCYNNWVKATLMNLYLKQHDIVLDLGHGKGGDLTKYNIARIARLFAFDIAANSMDEARQRYSQMNRPFFRASFTPLDCYNDSIQPFLPSNTSIDVVSMQFCAHYAFQTESQVRQLLSNVTSNLKPGGYFFGTIPDSNVIVRKLRAIPDLTFGNSIYKVTFKQKEHYPVYGHEYLFELVDAIDACPEYLIHWPSFTRLAREYDLDVIEHLNFHAFYYKYRDQFVDLLVRMKVVTPDEPEMPMEQWEAAGLYKTFVMQRLSK